MNVLHYNSRNQLKKEDDGTYVIEIEKKGNVEKMVIRDSNDVAQVVSQFLPGNVKAYPLHDNVLINDLVRNDTKQK